jgi:hypothetical protein
MSLLPFDRGRSNQAMELTAIRRYNMVFHSFNTSRAAARGLARGGSSWSR